MRHLELFAGIGGFRRAIDLVGQDYHVPVTCIGFSEIESKAVLTYKTNYNTNGEIELGDIVEFTSDELLEQFIVSPVGVHAYPVFGITVVGFAYPVVMFL